jgi:hypothetical protein
MCLLSAIALHMQLSGGGCFQSQTNSEVVSVSRICVAYAIDIFCLSFEGSMG